MGIFDKIKDAIFGHHDKAAAPASPTGTTINPTGTGPVIASTAPSATPVAPTGPAVNTTSGTPTAAPSQAPSATTASSGPVDVAAMLDKAVATNGQKLDWRHSIVDLMKALGMEASLSERKELAQELHYTGDANDSGKMNVFLHKALLQKLSENGGKVPAELLD
ncbi:DUF3597 domain-containing protein [Rhizobiaceae bacterium CRRU44]|uniref:DUF3597 domain-containing protein n=1 Tax=Ferranicluibacter rubi TaxID=2715133 RepID=A0AA44CAH3_9HYPH|nr:DUF3597 domain-containing protein [Ferranicluibacter rubi]NHT76175.1 DUF3597 domain-containing protein [Ferranicluibacter rubi]